MRVTELATPEIGFCIFAALFVNPLWSVVSPCLWISCHSLADIEYQMEVLTIHSATPPCHGTKQYSLVGSKSPILLYTHPLSQASSRGVSLNNSLQSFSKPRQPVDKLVDPIPFYSNKLGRPQVFNNLDLTAASVSNWIDCWTLVSEQWPFDWPISKVFRENFVFS